MEIAAVILTLLCVWTTFLDKRYSWLIGMAACMVYAWVFWQNKLYADFGLQIIFFAQSIIGFINWKTVKKREADPNKFIHLVLIGVLCWFVMYVLLLTYTDAVAPAVDSFLSVASLLANHALVLHWRQAWLAWMVIDVIYVGLFIFREMWWSAILYIALAFIAGIAFKQWKAKSIKLA